VALDYEWHTKPGVSAVILEKIISKICGVSETPNEKRLTEQSLLHLDCQALLYDIGIYGPLELEQIHKNIDRIKTEMLARAVTELRLDSVYTIRLNIDRSINILTKE
jgi:hypothetical protein